MAMKLINKNYSLVLSSEKRWEEFMDSLYVVLYTIRKDFFQVRKLCMEFYKWSEGYTDMILMLLDSFLQISYRRSKEAIVVNEYELEDKILVGGFLVLNNIFENTTTTLSNMPAEKNVKNADNNGKKNVKFTGKRKRNEKPQKPREKKNQKPQKRVRVGRSYKAPAQVEGAVKKILNNERKTVTIEEQMMATVMDPQHYYSQKTARWPRIDSAVKTAACVITEKAPAKWSPTLVNLLGFLPVGQMAAVLTRFPECNFLSYNANQLGKTFRYDWQAPDTQGNPSYTVGIGITGDAFAPNFVKAVAHSSSEITPHGDFVMAGAVSEERGRWFYEEPGATLNTSIFAPAGLGASDMHYIIDLLQWTPRGVESIAFSENTISASTTDNNTWVIADLASGDFEAAQGAYYTFLVMCEIVEASAKNKASSQKKPCVQAREKRNQRTDPSKVVQQKWKNIRNPGDPPPPDANIFADFGVYSTSAAATLQHEVAFGYEATLPSFQKSAITAQSIWYANTAQEAALGGSAYGQQSPGTVNWLSNLADPDGFKANPETKFFPAKTGIYGYSKPNGESQSLRTFHNLSAEGAIVDSFWPINGPDDYLMVLLDIPFTNLGNAWSGLWLVTNAIEWQTLDSTRFKSMSPIKSVTVLNVLDALKTQPQWFENSNHMSKIVGFIKKAATTALKAVEIGEVLLA
jgi:hypothetical protein